MGDDFNNPGYDISAELRGTVSVTTIDKIYNWSRRSSIWPITFGLACCAIEMICTAASRLDFARFGMEVMRPSPRQADLLWLTGTITKKMLPQVVRLYNQIPEPKYVVTMGACASGGGPFKDGYNVVSGIDAYLPVDVYIPGCPPTPQALLNGLISLQKLIDKQTIANARWYKKDGVSVVPIPILGPDLIDPRDIPAIKKYIEEQENTNTPVETLSKE
jgi:NADH-quinone oxidoreductase subunit B